MKNYYLVVRYRAENTTQVIKLNSRWYLENACEDVFSRANSLVAIDLVTTKFKSREEMLKRMYDNGYISSSDADIYIASKRKKNGKEYLKTLEVIYNPADSLRMSEFRDVAKAALDNDFVSEREKVKRIFDKLASKVFYNQEFRDYLKSGFTNIYKKILEAYVYSTKGEAPAYNVKYDNYWLLSNYIIIRNVIEAMNRFDLFAVAEDKINANIDYLNENGIDRVQVEKDLLVKLDKDYVEGQYNLFDMLKSSDNVNDIVEQTFEAEIDEEEALELTADDKKEFFYRNIGYLDSSLFKGGKRGVEFNTDFFESYPSVLDEQRLLNLSSKLRGAIYWYIFHYEKYREALERGQNTMPLEEELRCDRTSLRKLFNSPKNLDIAYEWLNTYLKCFEFKKMNSESQENLGMMEGNKGGYR